MLPAQTSEWCRYLWPYRHMLISCVIWEWQSCRAVGWIHPVGCLLWVPCLWNLPLMGAESDVSGARVRLSVQTHHSESSLLTATIKTTWAFWWRNRTKVICEEIKEGLCIFQLQSDSSLPSYPVTTHSLLRIPHRKMKCCCHPLCHYNEQLESFCLGRNWVLSGVQWPWEIVNAQVNVTLNQVTNPLCSSLSGVTALLKKSFHYMFRLGSKNVCQERAIYALLFLNCST